MKDYNRLTERRDAPLVMSMWAGDSHSLKIYNRLAELEDKIERGEIDYVSDKDKEIARLIAENQRLREEAAEQKSIAEHEHATQMEWFQIACDYKAENAEVRKQAVKEFADEFKRRYFFMMATYMKSPIYQCTGDELDRLVKEVCGE